MNSKISYWLQACDEIPMTVAVKEHSVEQSHKLNKIYM